MAIEFALGGALRGAGDTRFPLFAVMAGLIGGARHARVLLRLAGLLGRVDLRRADRGLHRQGDPADDPVPQRPLAEGAAEPARARDRTGGRRARRAPRLTRAAHRWHPARSVDSRVNSSTHLGSRLRGGDPTPMSKPLPVVDFLKIPESGDPYLEGHKCERCGAVFLGEREVCSKCGAREQIAAGEALERGPPLRLLDRAPLLPGHRGARTSRRSSTSRAAAP